MIKKIFNILKKKSFDKKISDELLLSLGQIQSKLNSNLNKQNINDYEFKVFSQWGEDGIIDFLIANLDIENKTFIEFGVENYEESNTKFLLLNQYWKGLIIDSSSKNIDYIVNSELYWRHSLQVECEFITKENINAIIKKANFEKRVGLLSIDIDGNDYWVWKEIEIIDPSIVIIEYNARFGKEKSCTVPYEKRFNRSNKHYSTIYYGASLKALIKLGITKGYAFVCCNKAGNNAFFVKKELLNDKIRENTLENGFYKNNFRESRNKQGNLNYLDENSEHEIISKLPLQEV